MKGINKEYVKRTQKDYSMSFKLSIVDEVERGELSVTGAQKKYGIQSRSTIVNWLRKFGTFDWENQTLSNMPKSKDQKILELEQKVFLEKQTEQSNKKVIFFDMMIDMAEKEFNIAIRKNSLPELLTNAKQKKK